MIYYAPWGVKYNVLTFHAVKEVSNKIKPGYFQANYSYTPTFWQKFWGTGYKLSKGKFYDKYEHREISKEIACYEPNTLLVWTVANTEYPTEWVFETAHEMVTFLTLFETMKACNYEPQKTTRH